MATVDQRAEEEDSSRFQENKNSTRDGNTAAVSINVDDLVMYGDMVDAAYMTFAAAKRDDDYDGILSNLLVDLAAHSGAGDGDDHHHIRYVATAHLYATAKPVPRLLDALPVLKGLDRPYWFGYVAVGRRVDCWDVVVAWRGSSTFADWMMNIHADLESFDGGAGGLVEQGFHKVYTSNDVGKPRGKLTAQKQVVMEVERLVGHLLKRNDSSRDAGGAGDDVVRVNVTVTGHSLGGALALMAAHDAAAALAPKYGSDKVRVRAVTFAAPHVGDRAFHDAVRARGVEVVRVVVKQDIVPWLPLGSRYVDVGDYNITLDEDASPLRRGPHNLDLYLHLLSLRGKQPGSTFTVDGSTDVLSPPANKHASRPNNGTRLWPQFEESDGYRRVPLTALESWNWTTDGRASSSV